jgi:hypothetical protein
MNHLCMAGKLKFYCLFDDERPEEDNFLKKEFVGVRFSPPGRLTPAMGDIVKRLRFEVLVEYKMVRFLR